MTAAMNSLVSIVLRVVLDSRCSVSKDSGRSRLWVVYCFP